MRDPTDVIAELKIGPSTVYRGKAWGRISAEDYDEAIQALQEAKTQLQPDGDNCHVCGDSGHQAWECHHNPLAMAREAAQMRHQWRCFHCGAVFTDEKAAAEHFGRTEDESPWCLLDVARKAREAERVWSSHAEDPAEWDAINALRAALAALESPEGGRE